MTMPAPLRFFGGVGSPAKTYGWVGAADVYVDCGVEDGVVEDCGVVGSDGASDMKSSFQHCKLRPQT
jgi:hypothetical protein